MLAPMMPMIPDRLVTRARAAVLGRYPSSAMACSTRAFVAGRILDDPLITRETVWWLTPASRATSAITGLCVMELLIACSLRVGSFAPGHVERGRIPTAKDRS